MSRLRVIDAAEYTGLSKSTLDKLRVYGGGPLYLKLGKRVVYDRIDLDTWLAGKRVANTSQPSPFDVAKQHPLRGVGAPSGVAGPERTAR